MDCGKRRYPDKRGAVSAANYAWAAGRGELRVYDCPDCGGWHITKILKNKPAYRWYKNKHDRN